MLFFLPLLYVVASQNYNPQSVQEAWDNHFEAFGAQNLTQIMKDYTEDSVAYMYDTNTDVRTAYIGLEAIEDLFAQLFDDLGSDLSVETGAGLGVHVLTVTGDMVYLVWEAPGAGFPEVTDSFVFSSDFTIAYQNIVAKIVNVDEEILGRRLLAEEEFMPNSTTDAWDNHFAAFGAQDLERIMLDYTEESELRIFDWANATTPTDPASGEVLLFAGLDEISGFFEGLFEDLFTLECLSVLPSGESEIIKEVQTGTSGMVFLLWESPCTGIEYATDTFVFNDEHKITYQNIVARTGPLPVSSSSTGAEDPMDDDDTSSSTGAEDPMDVEASSFQAGASLLSVMIMYLFNKLL